MADELSISMNLSFSKANCQSIAFGLTDLVTVAGDSIAVATQSIATTDTTLTFPSALATVGFCVFQNLDATNFITIGNDGADYPIRINAGEFAGPLRFNGTIHAKADTGACLLAFWIIEA